MVITHNPAVGALAQRQISIADGVLTELAPSPAPVRPWRARRPGDPGGQETQEDAEATEAQEGGHGGALAG